MSTITINEKIYQIADLTEAARQQIANIQFVDAELARLQQQQAVMQTARNAYVSALVSAVDTAPEAAPAKKATRSRSKKA
jgi:hypothetical protein